MDKKKIGIIGHVDVGRTTLAYAIEAMGIKHSEVILKPPDDIFTVKDKRYTQKVESYGNKSRMLALVKMYAGNYFRNEFTNTEDYLIIKEFRLIQDKKSNLSKSRRDTIEQEFNRRFQEIR